MLPSRVMNRDVFSPPMTGIDRPWVGPLEYTVLILNFIGP